MWSGVWGQARAFSQSELPRKPPIDTHGRYTYNTCTPKKKKGGGGGLKKKRGGGEKKKKGGGGKEESRNVGKSRNSDKSRKNGIPASLSSQTNFFVVETFTISSMNITSGTNRILPCCTKHGITLDLQKQMTWFKKQQKEQLFRFDMVPNSTHTFWTKIIFRIIFFCLYHFLYSLHW